MQVQQFLFHLDEPGAFPKLNIMAVNLVHGRIFILHPLFEYGFVFFEFAFVKFFSNNSLKNWWLLLSLHDDRLVEEKVCPLSRQSTNINVASWLEELGDHINCLVIV